MAEPDRFFFVHFQKTAGTSLFLRLRRHFGERAVFPMPEYEGRPLDQAFSIDELALRFAQHRDDIRVIAGHFPLCAIDAIDAPFSTFTILRDPVGRILSFLRQQRQEAHQFAGSSLEEIYDDPWKREFLLTNAVVRMLSLELGDMRSMQREASETTVGSGTSDEEGLARAKRNLVERIDVVGFQEHFEELCDELCARYGWDLGVPLRANATQPAPAPTALVERIERDNWADIELYRFALDRRDQRIRDSAAT